ncbi:MAG: tetratricopeptide (TPR) repeat protein [Nitrospinales bacterium]|jgi:tetratricopeptide (TPR) repeat protein
MQFPANFKFSESELLLFNKTHPFFIILALSLFLLGMTHPPLKKIDAIFSNSNSIKEFKQSETLILKSLKTFPNRTDLIWRLARNYFRIGKRIVDKERKLFFFENCLNTAGKGVEIDNNSAENIYFMGLCLGNVSLQRGIFSSLSNRDTLKTSMQRVIKIDPAVEYAGPHRFLGVYYHVLPFFLGGDSEKSIHHLESAVNLAPEFYENYFYLGKVYFDRGQYSNARKTLNRFLKLAEIIKNDSDLPKQVDEAQEMLTRIKTNNE